MPYDKAFQTLQRIHAHNGLLGCVAMSKQHMRRIIESDSTTHEAKGAAQEILNKLPELYELCKKRVDHDRI